ncbi:hypothetical protein FGADI_12940 [Fusarium gaditjirri]|uniref:Uncharacterized protein n=1 Tax=Fusarium gaditjirri TaxID=282569 RepID=A0A8H4WMN5_9HYPO|nr:hypothetical protein FGADI_12940 [Fusarium gaditjirri]
MSVGNETLYQKQAQRSTALVIKSARAIIKLTHYIDIECSTPVWLSFYYHFIAFENLFLCILHFPALSTIQMDLSLLDVIAGYFGRLELATAAAKSFPFVCDMAQCAHATVARYQSTTLEANGRNADSGAVVVSDLAYGNSRVFSETISADAMNPEVSMNIGMFPDSFPPEVPSHMDDIDFSMHDPLLAFKDTDLSWGLLSTILRNDAITMVSEP